MTGVNLPDGSIIFPHESVSLEGTLHVTRWHAFFMTVAGEVVVLSADRGLTEGDGIFFGSYTQFADDLGMS